MRAKPEEGELADRSQAGNWRFADDKHTAGVISFIYAMAKSQSI